MSNTGNWNTGDRNTGDRNTGNWNTGNWNTGDRNTGNRNTGSGNTGDRNAGSGNTGNWNTCDGETGFFNTMQLDSIRVFNKPCSKEVWLSAKKPDFLYFSLTSWIAESDMSAIEKEEHPEYKATGGYLRKYSYKEAFQRAWDNASKEDQELVTKLPNFDPEIFYEISGIKVDDRDGEEITIDGKVYTLKRKK